MVGDVSRALFFPRLGSTLTVAMCWLRTDSRVVYWMSGLSPTAAEYFYYLALAFSIDAALAAFFRMCVFLAPSVSMAVVCSSAVDQGREM